jgi:hypothetical protein
MTVTDFLLMLPPPPIHFISFNGITKIIKNLKPKMLGENAVNNTMLKNIPIVNIYSHVST